MTQPFPGVDLSFMNAPRIRLTELIVIVCIMRRKSDRSLVYEVDF